MITHISLWVAGIELSLTRQQGAQNWEKAQYKAGGTEPRAMIFSCASLAEANDRGEQRELRGKKQEQTRRRSPGDQQQRKQRSLETRE